MTFFVFQAEDGIRDKLVTGVQTCALPILFLCYTQTFNSVPIIRQRMDQDQQSKLKQLIGKGKEQGFLTYSEVNDHLPDGIVDPELIEDVIGMINDMGIMVHEKAPDSDSLILAEASSVEADEDAAEEAAAAIATVDS